MIATSQFTISVIKDGKDGAPGATGPQGVSVVKVISLYRLSDSSNELTGDETLPAYQWSEEKPEIPSGKYLWIRERTDLSNNTSEYGTAHCDIVTSGLVLDVDRNTNAITSKVWESDITTKINEYDGSTGKSIRDRVTKTETDISGINTTISDIQTDVAGKADGSTVTTLTTKVNTISDTVDGHTQTIESNTSRIDDAEDEIESTKTIASQTADKFTWLVKDGTSASNFTLTSRVAELISPQVVIKDPAGSATIISGGKIHANAITTAMLATDAIKSTNYTASPNASSPYSATGTYLNLTNGNFYTPNFGIDNVHGEAYLNGEIIATSGSIGSNATNYWEIGNVQDYNMTDSAVIRGHGTAYIQSGYWQLSNDKLNTQYYDSSQSSGVLTYYNNSGTYYDVGQKIPTNFAAYNVNDTPVVKWNKAWFYGRKYTGDSVPSFDSDWTYFFEVDSNGNVTTAGDIYEGGVKLSEKYAAITDIGSAYLPKTGGTITGNLTVNGAFSTNVMLQTNLASTSAGQLTGNANATVTHGVTGTLGVGNGGTGQTSAKNAANAFLNALDTGSSPPTDNDYYISQYAGGGTTITTYHRRPMSAMWTWIKRKIDSIYAPDTTYRKLTNNDFDTINVTDLNAGNLIVTGAGRFTNGLYGDLIGNVTGNVSGTSSGVRDHGNGTNITVQYSGSGISSATQFAAWSGYNIRAISAANTRNSIEAMYSPKITTAATADTMTSEGLYRIAFSHSGDTTFPTGNWGDLFTSNHGTMYQIWMGDNSMAPYKRIYNYSEGTWGAWSNIWDIGATKDGNGNTISSTYLKLSGGTLTGAITFNKVANAIRYTGSKATYDMIKFIDGTDVNGNGISIGGGGLVVIGSGEASNAITGYYTSGGTEELALGSDGGIRFFTNVQNGVASSFQAFWNGNGVLYPQTTNTGGLGSSSNKWADVYATTLHGKLDSKNITVGNTGKNVDWSGDVSWSKEEISDVASNTTDGWMSKDDKAKLDQITVSDIGTVGANSIKGATNGGIDVSITSGVATLKHTNQLSSGGTAQGTANNTTLTNGGSFTIPTVTYDINGHITTTGTNKLTLPNITSVSGNAGTATKFASAQSVTLTGDTTGTASSQAGWSLATTTSSVSPIAQINGDDHAKALKAYFDAHKATIPRTKLINFYSNANGNGSQAMGYFLKDYETNPYGGFFVAHYNNAYYVGIKSGTYTQQRIVTGTNYTDYTVTKTGSGASGTWGISITGNAATATSATTATTATNAHGLSYGTSDVLDTQEKIDDFLQGGRFMASVFKTASANNIGMSSNDGMILSASWHTNNTYGAQLAFDDVTAGVFKFRCKNKTWGDWNTVLHSGNYTDYTVPKTGGEFTGAVTGTSFAASSYISSNNGSGTAGGVNLYSRNATMEYAIMFRQTSNQVKHGYVQGDWATYLTMGGSASNVGTRGWIFKDHVNTKGVASISGAGHAVFNGSVTVGGNTANTSGMRMEYDATLQCTNFIFN